MLFFLVSSVSALAISSAYWDGLRLSPGETREIYLTNPQEKPENELLTEIQLPIE